MRKVIYLMSVSLDGYVEGPDGKFGWIKVRDTEMLSMEFDWTTW